MFILEGLLKYIESRIIEIDDLQCNEKMSIKEAAYRTDELEEMKGSIYKLLKGCGKK